jgi:hypothetical protein
MWLAHAKGITSHAKCRIPSLPLHQDLIIYILVSVWNSRVMEKNDTH